MAISRIPVEICWHHVLLSWLISSSCGLHKNYPDHDVIAAHHSFSLQAEGMYQDSSREALLDAHHATLQALSPTHF
jgi:hypothetical protein